MLMAEMFSFCLEPGFFQNLRIHVRNEEKQILISVMLALILSA